MTDPDFPSPTRLASLGPSRNVDHDGRLKGLVSLIWSLKPRIVLRGATISGGYRPPNKGNGRRLLLIKRGAMGEVLDSRMRSTPILIYPYGHLVRKSSNTRFTSVSFNSITTRICREVVIRSVWSKLCEVNLSCLFWETMSGPANQNDSQPRLNTQACLPFGELSCLDYSTRSLTNHRVWFSRTTILINLNV